MDLLERTSFLHTLTEYAGAAKQGDGRLVCDQMMGAPGISPVNQINPLRVLGTIRGRRGEAGAWEALDEALA